MALILVAKPAVSYAQQKPDAKTAFAMLVTLTQSTTADARKQLTDHGYILTDSQVIARPKYTLKVYKCQPVSRLWAFSFSAVGGQINTGVYDTYSSDDFKQIVKFIEASGFSRIADSGAQPNKMLYGKGSYHCIVKQTGNTKLTTYTIALTDIKRTLQFSIK